jgi:hypothetical protein
MSIGQSQTAMIQPSTPESDAGSDENRKQREDRDRPRRRCHDGPKEAEKDDIS